MRKACFWEAIPEGPGLAIQDSPYLDLTGDEDAWSKMSWDPAPPMTPCDICRHNEDCGFEKCAHRKDWIAPKEPKDG